MPDSFFWYDVMTTDIAAAKKFYADVVGWESQPQGPDYTVLSMDGVGVAGLMGIPDDAPENGKAMPPCWMGYIHVEDVAAKITEIEKAGGRLMKGPITIEGIITFAVIADPQGAGFLIAKPIPQGTPPRLARNAPGNVGWHELYAQDWKKVWPFYETLFGWTKVHTVDMGPMGLYQLFSTTGGEPAGGMMNRPPQVPLAYWNFYFVVPSVTEAAQKITDGGGQVLVAPMQVPGGGWILQARDPQGAVFALTSAEK
jgi:predicted enzyme related to lactoylglutathione lyase